MSTINLNNADAIYFGDRPVDRVYLGAQRVWPAWYPIELFSNGEQGAWYDPSDMSTLFQDAAGLVPVTQVGQYVGLMLDKSGNNFHIRQEQTPSRPQLREDSMGRRYLHFDGVDDFMQTEAYPSTRQADIFFAVNVFAPESLAQYLFDWRILEPSGNSYVWRVFANDGTGQAGGIDKLAGGPLNRSDGVPGIAAWRNNLNGTINSITMSRHTQRARFDIYAYFDVARQVSEQERQAAIQYLIMKSGGTV